MSMMTSLDEEKRERELQWRTKGKRRVRVFVGRLAHHLPHLAHYTIATSKPDCLPRGPLANGSMYGLCEDRARASEKSERPTFCVLIATNQAAPRPPFDKVEEKETATPNGLPLWRKRRSRLVPLSTYHIQGCSGAHGGRRPGRQWRQQVGEIPTVSCNKSSPTWGDSMVTSTNVRFVCREANCRT